MSAVAFDPAQPEFRVDPYPLYERLRSDAPVHFAEETGVYCISRYEDVLHVMNTPEDFSSRAMFAFLMNQGSENRPKLSLGLLRFMANLILKVRLNPAGFATARNLIAEDGERHRGMRNIVNRGFTPRQIMSWEPRARAIVGEIMRDLRTRQHFDLVESLSIPLPVTLIAEMLGVERERLQDFKRWSDVIIGHSTGSGRKDPFSQAFVDTMMELLVYVKGIAQERKKHPRDDLVSAIVAESDGDTALTVREVIQFVMLLLVAGNETTTNLIGNTVRALLANPEQLDRLIKEPGLLPSAIEEGVRYDSPVQLVFRTATRDVEIAGTTIPEGAFVVPLLGSANRDPSQFTDPDRFDVTRDPQGHLGFGFGRHFCLGASLARLEARVALEAIVPELARYELAEAPEMVDSFLVRGPQRLELRAAPRERSFELTPD